MIRNLLCTAPIAAVVASIGILALNPMAAVAQTEARQPVTVAEKASEISMGEEDEKHHEEMTKQMQEMMTKMQDKMSKMQEHIGEMTPEDMAEHHEQMMKEMQEMIIKMENMEGMMDHQH